MMQCMMESGKTHCSMGTVYGERHLLLHQDHHQDMCWSCLKDADKWV